MTRPLPSRSGRARRLVTAALAALCAMLVLAAGSAGAATATSTTITSSNWSGYAAHGSSTTFKSVSGRWRVPAATCTRGEQSFSSFWVGIGGYDANSDGLEQDGTELDCNENGSESVSAWYELLPAAPHTISLKVSSGDLISASVSLSGDDVTLTIVDLSTQRSFSKTIRDRDVDDTSAEWIAEAPSDCSTDTDCEVLPLADFGAVRFSNATATTSAGHRSGIETTDWTTTKLLLGYIEQAADDFVADTATADATPSALSDDSSEFTVAWSGSSATTSTGSSGTPTPGGGGGPGGGPSAGGPSGGQGPGGPGGF